MSTLLALAGALWTTMAITCATIAIWMSMPEAVLWMILALYCVVLVPLVVWRARVQNAKRWAESKERRIRGQVDPSGHGWLRASAEIVSLRV